MKNFALIGASGYIAPRHLKAIKDTRNDLLAALDPFDSVGILDSYFPNYLHDSHIRFGLRHGADVICEKPLVLNPWNLEALNEIEKETGQDVYNILQLRLHPSVIELKKKVDAGPPDKVYDIDLAYLTSRGHWYYTSWKGNINKSGGIATNIGVHFYDMLTYIFGDVKENIVHLHTHDRAAGYLELEKARVRWFLSINYDTIPQEIKEKGMRTYRSIKIGEETFEFSGGFTELHTKSYEEILKGNGFKLKEAEKAIQIVHDIRKQDAIGLKGNFHPYAKFPLSKHPFSREED